VIGNDIVDLNLAGKSSRWKSNRFLNKVFTPGEQHTILQSGNDRFGLIWQMWSMKESAYKVYIQQGNKPCYAPNKIHCQIYSDSSGISKIDDHFYRVQSEVTNEYIFSYSVMTKEKTAISQYGKITGNSLPSIQKLCRKEVLSAYSSFTGANIEHLKIQKCSRGIPRIWNNNQLESISISMTHHGNYYAYAMII